MRYGPRNNQQSLFDVIEWEVTMEPRYAKEHELRVTARINRHVLNFLNVTFNPNVENYQPCRKPNNDLLYGYVDATSN